MCLLQLSLLCQSLDQVWADNIGSVVLFTWQQLLATEALSTLGLDSATDICIMFEDPQISNSDWDSRAIQGKPMRFEHKLDLHLTDTTQTL